MTHTRYLGYIAVAGALSWLAWIVVIHKLDPFESTALALILFFVSLFFALTSTFTVIGYYLRLWMNKNEIFYNHINVSLRQGILLSVIALGCLGFQILGVLTWWLGLLLVAGVTLVEFYCMAKE